MNILFEDPDFNVFDIEDFEIEDLVQDVDLVLNIARATILDTLGIDCYNPEEDTFLEEEDTDTVQNLRYLYFVMPITSLHPNIIEIAYSQPVKLFQILFKIYKDNLIKPWEVRINETVKGKLLATCELELAGKLKPKHLYNMVFLPAEEDKKYSYITGIFYDDREKVALFASFKIHGKEYGNYQDLLIPYSNLTEPAFIKYARAEGYPVSSKSLRNYRSKSHQCIFPMPLVCKDPVTGIEKKYYDRTWVKYLKRIKELKEILKNNQDLYLKYNIKTLRDLDMELGYNSFKDIPYKKK